MSENSRFKFRAWHCEEGNPMYTPSMYYSYPFPVLFWKRVEDEPCTAYVMQFTGLLDKNVKEIFEGDILVCESTGSIGDVQFSNGTFGIEWSANKEQKSMIGSFGQLHNLRRLDDGISERLKIIGNIYENGGLLK